MQIRFLKHLSQTLAFIGIPFLYNYIVVLLNGDHGDPMFIGITILFFIINTFRLIKDYKINVWLSLFLAAIIIVMSYFVTFLLIRLNITLANDPFAIISMIIHNSIQTIILFEIIFHIKNISLKKQIKV
jgi:hypothetical protein